MVQSSSFFERRQGLQKGLKKRASTGRGSARLAAAVTVTALYSIAQWTLFRQFLLLTTDPGFGSPVRRSLLGVDQDFDGVLWPRLQQKLCPRGVPRLPLGPALFRLARGELGVPARAVHVSGKLTTTFFSGNFDKFSVAVDLQDPGSSLLYVPIWKCANSQIRAYLKAHFKQQPPEGGRDPPGKDRGRDGGGRPRRARGEGRGRARAPGRQRRSSGGGAADAGGARVGPLGGAGARRQNTLGAMRASRGRRAQKKPWSPWNATDTVNGAEARYAYRATLTAAVPGVPRDAKPCVFTVIRDPVSHFLSGYNEVEHRLLLKEVQIRVRSLPSLPSYAKLPHGNGKNKTGTVKSRADPHALRQTRFITFVRNLVEEHPAFKSEWWYMHLFPMSRVLHSLKRQGILPDATTPPSASDDSQWILPTVANITRTLPAFLDRRCPRFAAHYPGTGRLPHVEVAGVHKSRDDPLGTYRAAKDVWRRGGATARSLCLLLAFDYACFYGPPGPPTRGGAGDIPATCREVYASPGFLEEILG